VNGRTRPPFLRNADALPGGPRGGERDWRSRGACLTEDPELFHPVGMSAAATKQAEKAKAVCRRCDVVETCLRWALATSEPSGVWGGLTENERRAMKRREARARRAG
jgi:WhiB family redox-sensing transcriptional regulator